MRKDMDAQRPGEKRAEGKDRRPLARRQDEMQRQTTTQIARLGIALA